MKDIEKEDYSSKQFKRLYLNSLKCFEIDISKVKYALSVLNRQTDMEKIDRLLDIFNYTTISYKIMNMQYLILYITLYLQEKKIIQNDSVPVNTSLDMLLKFKWITDNDKEFLKKHYVNVLTNNLDYSKYIVDIDTYLNNANIFR